MNGNLIHKSLLPRKTSLAFGMKPLFVEPVCAIINQVPVLVSTLTSKYFQPTVTSKFVPDILYNVVKFEQILC